VASRLMLEVRQRSRMVVMPALETGALKVLGALGKFAPQMTSRLEGKIIAGHRAICGIHQLGFTGSRFSLTVAVGPSRGVEPLPPKQFTERALACAQLILGDLPFKVDHSSSELVRCLVPDEAPDAPWDSIHLLNVHPYGLIELQWGLHVPLDDPNHIEISLDEIVDVLTHMYRVAHHPTYHAIYGRRKGERFRRLDWRVGLTPTIVFRSGETIPWTGVTSSGRLPSARAQRQRPFCPITGYASQQLTSTKRGTPIDMLFRPALEQLLVDAGYIGVDDSVADALSAARSRESLSGDGARAISSGTSESI